MLHLLLTKAVRCADLPGSAFKRKENISLCSPYPADSNEIIKPPLVSTNMLRETRLSTLTHMLNWLYTTHFC